MPRLGFFPGSTIGNLDPAAGQPIPCSGARHARAGARFLVGVDLHKDPAILLPAYDDAAGVTAAFNRNLLVRLNREAGADFDPALRPSRGVERRRKPHRDAPGQPREQVGAGGWPRRSISRVARPSTPRTATSTRRNVSPRMAAKVRLALRTMWTDPAQLFSLLPAGASDTIA